MVEFQQPRPHCVVYLELKRDICASLFPSGNFASESFEFGGQEFFLMGLHHMDHLEVYLATVHGPCTFAFDYEFAGRYSIHAQEFVSRFKRSYTCEKLFSPILLFKIRWTCFMGEDRVLYFINDRFHLSVELRGLGAVRYGPPSTRYEDPQHRRRPKENAWKRKRV
ncbi:hypothetical protein HanPI659440_Chr16g0654481 [Helianthus annuus]|nr:hypothetical protein HanPI659440_Chr16g0654481 [Helianthus annuus]